MFISDAVFGADWPEAATYILPRNIPAIQVFQDETGRIRMGAIIKLPEGADVHDCGEGFDDHTRKVSWRGGFYYIFKEDIEFSEAARINTSAAG